VNGYEQLGLFYLGKRYDLDANTRINEPVLYDSKDLVTHAMCVGMTGSGKTGLGITLIEEAAIDGVPVLAIDPKGDLANLLLTFPHLDASDFLPWIDPAEAATRKLSPEDHAAGEAERWRAGLAEWDQTPERVATLKTAANVRVYTPGSRAATPLAILNDLGARSDADEADVRAADLSSTAASLLALVGYDTAEPHSREQALIAAILDRPAVEVQTGVSRGLDLGWLVQQIQRPSFDRVGVLDLETFYPAKERQELALRFNSVLASPGFDVWLNGDPLDPASLLFTPEGRPRVAIVSIAHLDDTKRMLVVSLLLNAILQWTRRQRGTGSLRALIYMDEVFGYLPPVANPPSKLPLLTLLKQARAFGVGIALATQNPVDLDYKALSNIGTWFLGKLQTERDKTRVLDGLEGAGGGMDRAMLDRTLSALRSRVFLMHNVNEPAPMLFETRWTLSYLRGPLGRDELRRLSQESSQLPTSNRQTTPTSNSQIGAVLAPESPKPRTESLTAKPVIPAGIREVFLRGNGPEQNVSNDPNDPNDPNEYAPVLYGAARVHYTDARRGIDVTEDVIATVPFSDGAVAVDWERADSETEAPETLATAPQSTVTEFSRPPADALNPKRYVEWSRDFEQWIVRARPLTLYEARSLKLTSRPGESERDFRIRVQQATREARDAQVEKLRAKYAPRVERLTGKLRQSHEALGREQQQAQQQKVQTAVSFGATLLGAVLGRRAVSLSTLGRATTAARGVGRAAKELDDVTRASERVQRAQEELNQLQEQLDREVDGLVGKESTDVETVAIKPKRGSIDVRLIALAWKLVNRRSATPATP
jgi:hypothetical protein